MSDEEIHAGDSVTLRPSWGWTQPWRKFADEGRVGEVMRVFTAMGARQPTYVVKFPVKRKGATPHQLFADRADLVPTPSEIGWRQRQGGSE